jgi:DNA-binding CsgD family transcriptional regulator
MPDKGDIWSSLTAKQREAISLVANGYTSKEAARILDITPKVFDRRVDVVRRRLGDITRAEAAREFREHFSMGETFPREPFPLHPTTPRQSEHAHRSGGENLAFASPATFVERAPWEEFTVGSLPEIEPAQLGIRARLFAVVIGAIGMTAILLLLLGIVNGLDALVFR